MDAQSGLTFAVRMEQSQISSKNSRRSFQKIHLEMVKMLKQLPLKFHKLIDAAYMQHIIVGEPKSRIVQKHTFFAPKRYTAGILYTDSLNSA